MELWWPQPHPTHILNHFLNPKISGLDLCGLVKCMFKCHLWKHNYKICNASKCKHFSCVYQGFMRPYGYHIKQWCPSWFSLPLDGLSPIPPFVFQWSGLPWLAFFTTPARVWWCFSWKSLWIDYISIPNIWMLLQMCRTRSQSIIVSCSCPCGPGLTLGNTPIPCLVLSTSSTKSF